MLCKNCAKEIEHRVFASGELYLHIHSDRTSCDLVAEPIMGYVNRKLDAKAIIAEMEARSPRVTAQPRPLNPDLVEGSFEGEL